MNTMKLMAGALLAVTLMAWSAPAQAQAERGLSPAVSQPAAAQGDSFFNRMGDWFATLGKPEGEKELIKAERRAKREAERLKDQAEESMERLETGANEMKDDAKDAAEGLPGDATRSGERDVPRVPGDALDATPGTAGDRVESRPGPVPEVTSPGSTPAGGSSIPQGGTSVNQP